MLQPIRLLTKGLLVSSLIFFGMGCDEDNPSDPGGHEEELITTVRVKLTPQGGGAAIEVTWKDLDGEGGNNPTIDNLTLQAGTTYTGEVTLLNEEETPAENVNEEIEREADEHQFFYKVTGAVSGGVTGEITDKESDYASHTGTLPVGLKFKVTVTAGTTGSGVFNIALSHYDDSPKNGTDRSDETDIDVDFPLTIQ